MSRFIRWVFRLVERVESVIPCPTSVEEAFRDIDARILRADSEEDLWSDLLFPEPEGDPAQDYILTRVQ